MEDLAKNRHSLAHIMAYAVMDLYPGVKFAIGPDIDTGFYYDFDFQFCKSSPTPDDFPRVENQMREIIKKNIAFQRRVISKKEALNLFHDQPYKLELINDLPDNEEISIYSSGAFTDLCKGPHVESTKDLNSESFKIAKLAGAYWRGDEKNPMLTRIYAYAFADAAQLQSFLEKLAEAEKRDHRVLGQKLDLFHIDEQIGPGLLLWHPKGALLKRLVETYILDACLDNGYKLLSTPHIAKLNLWNTSGHTGFYRDSMFPSFNLAEKDAEEKVDYQLKPMNCPFHILVYKNSLHSYRELPIRYTELGTVYRYEKSGTLHGLTRVRGFTQDDAHIFCAPDQIEEEVEKLMEFTFKIVKDFGFKEFNVYLSTRPQDSIGTDQHWQMAESALSNSLKKMDILYHTDEGGGAFYGPKID
ncbi:MAG TPA: threonine--tRNA ligase, partial [Candidatus Pacearchaeota archaeon]|nr:threonine--tRNA ligase [Candidatus Pacearchaeota archaeon]